MSHLDEEQLFHLTLGQLGGDAEPQVQAHLAGCDECRARHERLSSIGLGRTVAGAVSVGGANNETRSDRAGAHLTLERGATLGRYVVLEKLGAGGMGDVFAAYDPHLDRKVAVKLLRVGSLTAEEGKTRLLREAQAMARLQHPNVIAVHDVGTLEDRVFIAMEFVDGETVSEWVRSERTWGDVIELFLHAGSGLAAAHRAGLVHRDFKPDNVLVDSDGRPRVLDFGLARQATVAPLKDAQLNDVPEGSADTPLTQPLTRDGAVLGTPGYMAPEQLAGLDTDARSDQFAFCVALYEALYGRRPFGGGTLKQHAAEMSSGQALAPPDGSQVPAWIHEVLVKGLSVRPGDRWPDMDALLHALRPRERRRSRNRLFVAGLLAFATAGIGYGLWTRQRLMVCGGQEARLAGAWDTPVRAKLKAAFLATGQPFASEAYSSVEKTLDGWALDWVNASREACEATKLRKVDSEELMGLKLACLEDRRQSLESTVTLFAQADRDVVMNAPAATKLLELPRTCLSRRLRAPRDEDRKAEQEVRGYLSRARALFDAGKYAQASEALEPGLRLAATPRVLAEAWLLMGRIQTKRHEPRAARLAHLAAGEQALKAADESAIAVSLSRLYANEGFDENEQGASAEVLGRLARAAAARVPGEWEVQVELASNSAHVEIGKGRLAAARADLERALSLQREHLPFEHPDIASTLNSIGIVLTRLGQVDEAIRSYQQSLAIHEAVEGPRHPNTATSAHNLAVTYRELGRLDDARVLFERAVSARREALGPMHADTLNSELSLAKTCVAQGDFELAALLMGEARAVYEESGNVRDQWSLASTEAELQVAGGFWKEALGVSEKLSALAQKLQSGDSPLLGAAALVRGRALTGLGNWAEAHRALAEARRLTAKAGAEDRAEVEEALGRLAHAQGHAQGQGAGVEAAVHFERALALREQMGFTSPALGETLLELGRCRIDAGRGADAVALGAQAEQLFLAMQVRNSVARARWIAAQGQWLSGTDGGASPAEVQEAAAALPAAQREAAHRWLKTHGLVPDAGTVP